VDILVYGNTKQTCKTRGYPSTVHIWKHKADRRGGGNPPLFRSAPAGKLHRKWSERVRIRFILCLTYSEISITSDATERGTKNLQYVSRNRTDSAICVPENTVHEI
jgi:hypothetical protein